MVFFDRSSCKDGEGGTTFFGRIRMNDSVALEKMTARMPEAEERPKFIMSEPTESVSLINFRGAAERHQVIFS